MESFISTLAFLENSGSKRVRDDVEDHSSSTIDKDRRQVKNRFHPCALFAVVFVQYLTGARINREFEEQLQSALQDLD